VVEIDDNGQEVNVKWDKTRIKKHEDEVKEHEEEAKKVIWEDREDDDYGIEYRYILWDRGGDYKSTLKDVFEKTAIEVRS
jgi:hypothetical protein